MVTLIDKNDDDKEGQNESGEGSLELSDTDTPLPKKGKLTIVATIFTDAVPAPKRASSEKEVKKQATVKKETVEPSASGEFENNLFRDLQTILLPT